MSLSKLGIVQSRLGAVIVTDGVAFLLLWLLLVPGGLGSAIGIFVVAALGAALLAVWVTRRGTSPRSTWGVGCLINGLLSAAVAIGFCVPDDLGTGRSQYVEDLDRAIGPLTHFVWALAARIGLIVLIMAAILFALSYWLLGPPRRKA
jgi:hypothetical protein